MQAQLDVLIVGAGLSGVGAAYHLETMCPGRSYGIVEARERLGGTWDLFRYPGIRSDSDMYTLGYRFRPWKEAAAIGDGGAILKYVRDTAEAYGIDKKIRYGKKMLKAAWSSADARWTVTLSDAATGVEEVITCGFLWLCTGYYSYDAGYLPEFPGRERFKGRVVHPQAWTHDIDYAGKKVVVIGSGATAVTLVPEMAKTAAHVTMLQRSPSYVMSMPMKDPMTTLLRKLFGVSVAFHVTRWRNVILGIIFFWYCRKWPEHARERIQGWARKQLGERGDLMPHFEPKYAPWDQRLCLAPDGDLFATLRSGKASVVTDHIETFTETGIKLKSGKELEADLIVTATGLRMHMLGGAKVEVDGKPVEMANTLVYRGVMGSDVPNLAMAVGYTNASWTLKVDLAAQYVCRVLNYMRDNGLKVAVPRATDRSGRESPLLDFSSGYVQRSLSALPKQGPKAPWRLYQNYVLDLIMLRHGSLTTDMEFR